MKKEERRKKCEFLESSRINLDSKTCDIKKKKEKVVQKLAVRSEMCMWNFGEIQESSEKEKENNVSE